MDERSIQAVLTTGLVEAEEQFQIASALNMEIATSKFQFIAGFLVRKLTPILTAIQEHDAVCPTFKFAEKTGATLPGKADTDLLVAHVTGKLSVDGAALPPFYTRQNQDEIGGAHASRFHVGE